MKTDSEIIDWLERNHNLHTAVEMLYVVDGYEVYMTYDSEPIFTFKGETLREALSNAMCCECTPSKRGFRIIA